MSVTEMTPEPDWLAAEPSAGAKLTAIMAAVRRCYAECAEPQLTPPTGPHLSTVMAELFIGQLLMVAAGDGDLNLASACMEGVRAERERIRVGMFACDRCGEIHGCRKVSDFAGTWAAASDGHAYAPVHVGHRPGWQSLLASLLEET